MTALATAARESESVHGKSRIAASLFSTLMDSEREVRREYLATLDHRDRAQVLAVAQREGGTPFVLWQDDPRGFVEDVLGERTWSIPNTLLDAIPRHRRIAVPSAFSTGKTWSVSRSVLWHSCVYPVGTARVVTIAAKWSQVRTIIWPEIRRAHARAGLPGSPDVAQLKMPDANGQDYVVAEGIAAAPHNETAVQGLHAPHLLLIVDEAGGIGPRVGRNLSALLTAHGTSMVAIGNPPTDDEGSWFEVLCSEDRVLVLPISALSTPNFTGEKVGACLSCPPEVPRHPLSEHLASQEAVQEVLDLHGEESPYYQAKVLARFPKGGPSRTLPSSWVDTAVEKPEPEADDPQYVRLDALGLPEERASWRVKRGSWVRLGVDVAADGGDEFSIARAVGDLVTIEHASAGASNAEPMVVAGQVLQEIRRCEALREAIGSTSPIHVKVDVIGVGWGVAGILRSWAEDRVHSAVIVDVDVRESTYREPERASMRPARKRDELWLSMRSLLAPKVEALRLRVDRKTAAQLMAPTYKTNSSGETVIESKDSMKRRGVASPDRGEAALLSVYEPVQAPSKKKKARLLV